MKIKTKITLWFTVLIVFLTIISNTILVMGITHYIYNHKVEHLYEKVSEIEQLINIIRIEHKNQKTPFTIENYDLLAELVRNSEMAMDELIYIQITDLKGIILSSSTNLKNKKLPILKTGTLGELTVNLPESDKDVKILYLSSVIHSNNKNIAMLQVGIPLTEHDKLFQQMIIFVFFNIVLSIIIALFFGAFLSERSLAPMLSVTNEVNKMAGKNLLKPIDTSDLSKDEIGILVNTFNNLIQRISKVFNFHQRFISDASHELRSPLTAIKGYAQLILKRGVDKPDLVKEGVQVIIKESERLEKLVNDMLYLVRTGERSKLNEEVDIISIIRQLVLELKTLHPNLNIEQVNYKAIITGEPDSLKRVFINLINNALKAVETGGEINISYQLKENNINILIADNGIGIEEEHLKHIFERFYRVDSSRERDRGGSGLGLSIVKEIIENNNGKIAVISKKNEGTTFTVTLPVNSVIYQEGK